MITNEIRSEDAHGIDAHGRRTHQGEQSSAHGSSEKCMALYQGLTPSQYDPLQSHSSMLQ